MRILNPDGSEAEACGNGTRCVATLLGAETGRRVVVHRDRGRPACRRRSTRAASSPSIWARPRIDWRDIPLAREMDTLHVDLALGPLADPVCTSMGNPHATFFVADAEAHRPRAQLGPSLEHDALFPERANIGVATVRRPDTIRLRVWERGAGITRACGSGACAALVAAHRRGLDRRSSDSAARRRQPRDRLARPTAMC